VYCWGRNNYGQLGNGTTTDSTSPIAATITGASALTVGQRHACIIGAGGAVSCWGFNATGALGNGNTTNQPLATPVAGLPAAATAIAAGQIHTCAVLSTGAVYCWGDNGAAQLGNGGTTSSLTPVQVSGIGSAVAISTWGSHTCVRLSDSSLRCWGQNTRGQIGNNTVTAYAATAVQPGGSGYTLITAGGRHTCGLQGTTVRCWGFNAYGQVGDGTAWYFPVAGAVEL
jgi:alpha-tubulin suppressor-like RCC1 family protein